MAGKIAVGSVILERVEHRNWDGKTIPEVCLMPYQFSCYLPTEKTFSALRLIAGNWAEKHRVSIDLQQCYNVARGLIDGLIQRTPEIAGSHCCQYLNPETAPKTRAKWLASGMKTVAIIGNHEFFA